MEFVLYVEPSGGKLMPHVLTAEIVKLDRSGKFPVGAMVGGVRGVAVMLGTAKDLQNIVDNNTKQIISR